MRAGLSTIQQALTPEAASVMTLSVAEAARRKHGQTTPLHVAATLLAAPSGLLRRACVSSHPDSAHPLQCRALDLCFSVALDRLPSSPSSGGAGVAYPAGPPISNALKAAIKRAQAHQRRGSPEQQQTPLLAVKVELEQLLISILDDPSVSRVMREASFSSTAVKAAVEQSLSSSSSSATTAPATTSPSLSSPALSAPSSGFALGYNLNTRASPAHSLYMNPRLHQHRLNGGASAGAGAEQPRTEELKRVMDILLRSNKRNPVLVGDSDPDAVMKQVLYKIESGDAPPPLQTAKVVSFAKELATGATSDLSWIPERIRELGSSLDSEISQGVVLDLGDLKWLVESPGGSSICSARSQPQKIVCEVGRAAMAEMRKLLKMFEESGRLWLVGTAACATYLRCQVYHPTMENDWDLQAMPIAPRSPMFPRLGVKSKLSSSGETPSPTRSLVPIGATATIRSRPTDSTGFSRRTTLCSICMANYENELSKLVTKEVKKSSSKMEDHKALPQWLQLAKLGHGGGTKSSTDHLQAKEEEEKLLPKQSTEELLKKWQDTCSRFHPISSHPVLLPAPILSEPLSMFAPRPSFDSELTLSQNQPPHQLRRNQEKIMLNPSPTGSPVKTDLVLGYSTVSNTSLEKTHEDRLKDISECTQDEFSIQRTAKVTGISDIDAFKRLLKGLIEEVGWQQEAASAVATSVMQCKPETRKRQGGGAKGDTWLLFVGPDKVGKRKMAAALSEAVFETGPTTISFSDASCTNGDDGESNMNLRGRTSMDRVAEAVRRNPFSMVVLEDIDQADGLVHVSIKRAMERGRLLDSYGREVRLGSVIFILTSSWLPEELKSSHDSLIQFEEKILHSASHGWQLELSAERKPRKRCADWLCDGGDRQLTKLRRQSSSGTGLSLDLNLAVGMDDEAGEGSRNSSDLTTDHDHAKGRLAIRCSSSSASELIELVDNAIMFKPVDFGPLRRNVLDMITKTFAKVMGDGWSIMFDEEAVDRIVRGAWLGGAAFDEWAERVLIPNLKQLRCNLKADESGGVVRLSVVKGDRAKRARDPDWLPATVAIAVDGL